MGRCGSHEAGKRHPDEDGWKKMMMMMMHPHEEGV
jgi:hypothetical protein